MTLRAHLATFPARRALMLDVVARLAPQVDVLHVCLNQYDSIPTELAAFGNVKPTIPARDLMDAGKFLPQAFPDDRVLLVDDDIAYPSDYARRLARMGERIDLTENVVGFQGLVQTGRGVRTYHLRRKLGAIRGVGQLATGTALILGKYLPKLAQMEPAKGWVDVRFASHLADLGLRGWALPRQEGWLNSLLPEELQASSLHERYHRMRPDLWQAEQTATLARFDHMGMRLRDFRAQQARPAPKFRIVRS